MWWIDLSALLSRETIPTLAGYNGEYRGLRQGHEMSLAFDRKGFACGLLKLLITLGVIGIQLGCNGTARRASLREEQCASNGTWLLLLQAADDSLPSWGHLTRKDASAVLLWEAHARPIVPSEQTVRWTSKRDSVTVYIPSAVILLEGLCKSRFRAAGTFRTLPADDLEPTRGTWTLIAVK